MWLLDEQPVSLHGLERRYCPCWAVAQRSRKLGQLLICLRTSSGGVVVEPASVPPCTLARLRVRYAAAVYALAGVEHRVHASRAR